MFLQKGWLSGLFSKIIPKARNEMKLPDDNKKTVSCLAIFYSNITHLYKCRTFTVLELEVSVIKTLSTDYPFLFVSEEVTRFSLRKLPADFVTFTLLVCVEAA